VVAVTAMLLRTVISGPVTDISWHNAKINVGVLPVVLWLFQNWHCGYNHVRKYRHNMWTQNLKHRLSVPPPEFLVLLLLHR
jgi:hypothetical protein